MSADLLRRAAAKMRENANGPFVTSSPWGRAVTADMGFAVHRGEHDTVALYASRDDAAHIASWHPDVALAVADWLDNEDLMCGGYPNILAVEVARAYLREA